MASPLPWLLKAGACLFFLASIGLASTDCTKDAVIRPLPGNLKAGGSSEVFDISSDSINRTYRLYIPSNYDPTAPSPLIVSYHGNGGNAAEQEHITQFSEEKYNDEFVVVYGEGLSGSWEGASYAKSGVDDVQYTADLLDHLEGELCLDTNKIFANGKSNGGGFVSLLSCDSKMSSRFTAFSAVAGAFYQETYKPCNPTPAVVPFMEIHGMEDNVVDYYGGNGMGGTTEAIPTFLEDKATMNGCSKSDPAPTNKTILNGGDVWLQEWDCDGSGKPSVVAYNETTMRHTWPGTEQTGSKLVYATPKILDFYKQWF